MCTKNVFEKMSGDESGFVLILTMVMLAILSILGVMVLNTTDTELNITSNTRMQVEALKDAERVLQYAEDKIIKDRPSNSVVTLNTDEVKSFIPGSAVDTDYTNEIKGYSDAVPSRIAARFSVDATSKGNIFSTTGGGVSANLMPYYRATASVKHIRSSARVETVQVDMTSI